MVAALCPVKRASIVTTALLQAARQAAGQARVRRGGPGAADPRARVRRAPHEPAVLHDKTRDDCDHKVRQTSGARLAICMP